ncbi:MAG: hypothetical protein ACKVII_17430 [Planctomycetales bacterium]|jgi:hypothetical protein
MSEFIEFSISSPERFDALRRVFEVFKQDKDTDEWRSNDELHKFFDDEALSKFHWPPDDPRRQRLADLRTRPIIITPTAQATGLRWDLDSLIDAFVNGEYELVSCEMIDAHNARLDFYALGYPYGGVGCMVALVEAFGSTVTGIQDGTGLIEVPRK